ncbi:hypothetical protein V6N12_050301 [Hibiscus sabdariffa]|uniref:Putative plant transposon protein domain-containing protein n=1 Tax=Hibiscus sabdariffa TaxID=183260 RepID=A0ABR2GC12_9ROSI
MASSSSSSAHDMPPRYQKVAAKSRWDEHGFFFEDAQPNYGLEPIIYKRLNDLGWFHFARQPARANLNWVLEFYTSNAAGEDTVTVRGRRVPANSATINSILNLPNDSPSIYELIDVLEEEDLDTIKDQLMQRCSIWIISYGKKRKELHFKEYMIQGFCQNQVNPLEVPGNRLPETGSRRTLLPARASTKDPESTQAENSSTCRDTYLGRQGKYNRECDMISIFFQTPLDQERIKPRPKTISRADPKPKHTVYLEYKSEPREVLLY